MGNSPSTTEGILANIRRWHGKQFTAKTAFLKHVDDEPRFGNKPTFSMPLTTEDLAVAIDRQHHEEYGRKNRRA